MKIKLFYEQSRETLEDFEARVNEFTQSHNVLDIKFQEAISGNSEDINTFASILVLYNEPN